MKNSVPYDGMLTVVYFDLRKYGSIERSLSPPDCFRLLEEFQRILYGRMDAAGFDLYQVHADTAIWFSARDAGPALEGVLRSCKTEAEALFSARGFDSRLSVLAVRDNSHVDIFDLGETTRTSIIGPVMNALQKGIREMDASLDPDVNEGVVILP